MGQKLYQRQFKLTASIPVSSTTNYFGVQTTTDDLIVTDLRMTAQISKSDGKEPNQATVVVSNLNANQRGKLQQKGVKILVDAGYANTGLSRILRMDARTVDHVRNGADWDTTIKGAEGERSYQNARVSESFAPGTGAGDVLNYLANASGLQIGNVPSIVLNLTKTFDQGYIVSGRWKDEMHRFLRGLGYAYSTQSDTLQVLFPGTSTNKLIPLISPETGLLDSPEFGSSEKKGKPALVKFKSLMTPCSPGALVHLRSERYDGQVYIKKVSYSLDSYGGPWETAYEGILQK